MSRSATRHAGSRPLRPTAPSPALQPYPAVPTAHITGKATTVPSRRPSARTASAPVTPPAPPVGPRTGRAASGAPGGPQRAAAADCRAPGWEVAAVGAPLPALCDYVVDLPATCAVAKLLHSATRPLAAARALGHPQLRDVNEAVEAMRREQRAPRRGKPARVAAEALARRQALAWAASALRWWDACVAPKLHGSSAAGSFGLGGVARNSRSNSAVPQRIHRPSALGVSPSRSSTNRRAPASTASAQ
jgi:hypothetical protein